jgi:hypothetical protein
MMIEGNLNLGGKESIPLATPHAKAVAATHTRCFFYLIFTTYSVLAPFDSDPESLTDNYSSTVLLRSSLEID